MLLYWPAKVELVDQVSGQLGLSRVVIADRNLLANVVYQGHAGGLDPEAIASLAKSQ